MTSGPDIPFSAYLRGKGRVRVLSYEGDGFFRVLTTRDETVYTHRERLVFLP